jgi:septum formation protein
MARTSDRLILASASTARQTMLRAAGVPFIAVPANIDEWETKRRFRAKGGTAIDCAMALAESKACAVASRYPDAVVIGADQILVLDDEWLDKPADLDAAIAQLRKLAGRTHVLATAACAMYGDRCVWRATSEPELTMRRFGERFLVEYIAAEGNEVLGSVGAYRIEGPGIQLFSRIAGDQFAILGLPMLELLEFLRERRVIEG